MAMISKNVRQRYVISRKLLSIADNLEHTGRAIKNPLIRRDFINQHGFEPEEAIERMVNGLRTLGEELGE